MKLPPEPLPTVEVDARVNEMKTVRVDQLNRTERNTIKLPPRTNSFVEPPESITLDTLIKAREGGRAAANDELKALLRAWWAGVACGAAVTLCIVGVGVGLTFLAIKWGASSAAAIWHWVTWQ